MTQTGLPPSASIATPIKGGKLHAPSALRNLAPIVEMLRAAAPDTGRALEIASGTGQHIAALAAACPRLHWHPTEVAPERITSINAYAAEAALPNLQAAQTLDATETGWAEGGDPYDLVYLGNLLHLIPDDAASTLIAESAKALTKKGNS